MSDLDLGDGFLAAGGRFLWHERERVVVVADLHLGVGESRRGAWRGFSDSDDEGVRWDWGKVVERVGERGAGGDCGGICLIRGSLVSHGGGGGERGVGGGVAKGGVEVEMVGGNHDLVGGEVAGEILVGTRVQGHGAGGGGGVCGIAWASGGGSGGRDAGVDRGASASGGGAARSGAGGEDGLFWLG